MRTLAVTATPPSQAGVMEIAPGLLGHALINVRQAISLRSCRNFLLYPLSKSDGLNYNPIHTTNLMNGQFHISFHQLIQSIATTFIYF